MQGAEQYTILKIETITLSNLAKERGLSRSLLFEIMLEKKILKKVGTAKKITAPRFGYTTQHVTRTSIYIYADKADELFELLEIPKIEKWEKICFKCRKVLHVNEFFERMATCKVCKREAKKSTLAIDEPKKKIENGKTKINPYFLTRGLKYD